MASAWLKARDARDAWEMKKKMEEGELEGEGEKWKREKQTKTEAVSQTFSDASVHPSVRPSVTSFFSAKSPTLGDNSHSFRLI